MGIVELIEIGLADADEDRLEATSLEPADIAIAVVAGLSQVVAQLARTVRALSAGGERIALTGRFEGDSYLVSISGIPAPGSEVLDRMWEDPELSHGLAAAARLAARHRLDARFVPEGARLTVPPHLVTRREGRQPLQAVHEESPADFVPHELDPRAGLGVAARPDSSWSDSEAFLEEVFAPLMRQGEESSHPAAASSLVELEPGNVAVLGVRVPGESYSLAEDHSPSTAPAEGAVDLKSALSTFDQGRRSAQQRNVG